MPSEPTFSPFDVYNFVQNEGHGVKGLVDNGIQTLPKQYIHPKEGRLDFSKVTNYGQDHSIPIIDMSNSDDPMIQARICNAAEKWGFFQIINHGVPLKVLEDVKAATYRFFELSVKEKSKYLMGNSPSKHVRYGTSFVPHAEKALEWKDYLSLFFVSEDHAHALWPIACRDEALEYLKSSEPVTKRLMQILMKGLNISEIDQAKESSLMGCKRINFNFYPNCPNPELTFGVGRHSDVSTLTILLQDDVGGLFIRRPRQEDDIEGGWIHIPPLKGGLVINVGDALQILSNGKYQSVEHCVIANGSKDRVSVPIFVNPLPTHVIAPFQELIERGEKPMYKSDVRYSDYVKHFYRNSHDGKATIDLVKA